MSAVESVSEVESASNVGCAPEAGGDPSAVKESAKLRLGYYQIPQLIVESYRSSAGVELLHEWQAEALCANNKHALKYGSLVYTAPTSGESSRSFTGCATFFIVVIGFIVYANFESGLWLAVAATGGKTLVAEVLMLRQILYQVRAT